MNALAIVAVLGVVACGFHPNAATTGGDDDGSNDGGVHSDGGGSDGGTTLTGPCGTAGAIRDDFDDNATAPQWASLDSETMETGGELVTSPVTSGTGPTTVVGFGGYISRHVVDLSAGASVDVEVTGVFAPSPKAYTEFLLYLDTKNYVGIVETNSTIFVQSAIDGAGNPQTSLAYDATAQKWWRVSEASDGSVTMFTSPDDVTWTQLGTPIVNAAAPHWIDHARIALTGLNVDTVAHGSTKFDNLNQGIAAAPWCKTETFVDAFDRSTVGAAWSASRPNMMGPQGCTPMVMNGASFDQTGMAADNCYLASEAGFDLTSSHITAHTSGVTNPKPGWTAVLRYQTDEGNAVGIEIDQTNHLCTIAGQAASEVCTVAYDPAAMTYWRMTAASGTIAFESSADNTSWTAIGTATVTFPLTAGDIVIGSLVTTPFTMGPIDFEVAAINPP